MERNLCCKFGKDTGNPHSPIDEWNRQKLSQMWLCKESCWVLDRKAGGRCMSRCCAQFLKSRNFPCSYTLSKIASRSASKWIAHCWNLFDRQSFLTIHFGISFYRRKWYYLNQKSLLWWWWAKWRFCYRIKWSRRMIWRNALLLCLIGLSTWESLWWHL